MSFSEARILIVLAILYCAQSYPAVENSPPQQNDPICDKKFRLYFPGEEVQEEGLRKFNKKAFMNPEEAGPYFEGDILLTPEDIEALNSGLRDERYRWPNATVPYFIASSFTGEQLRLMGNGMRMITSKTCIKFRPATSADQYYLKIQKHASACNSYIGRLPLSQQPQPVNLADWCFTNGNGTGGSVAHELIHALGFDHEHTRSDRDDAIYVVWDNIQQDSKHNFCSNPASKVSSFGVAYDYGSVMHYGLYSGFAVNQNEPVMLKRQEYSGQIGQRAKLSDKDIQKVSKMYNCR